ncbi:MAG TPA: phosphate--acyl-ACP acyltransferase, partial [Oscillospiraceae bacterium]|nr:phosphate--acyl-ACP acyltransferase [Oscillospiraceae bacterium]
PLLGVNGVVIKAHGSSDAKAIMNAIKQAKLFVRRDVVKSIRESL